MNFLSSKLFSTISIFIYFIGIMIFKPSDIKIMFLSCVIMQLMIYKFKPDELDGWLLLYYLVTFLSYVGIIRETISIIGN
jgi:hypothetical protein